MPKQTSTTYVGIQFDVSPGTMGEGDQEVPVRVLHVIDGADRIDIPMTLEAASALADALRQDHVITAKVVPPVLHIAGTKKGR